LRYLWIEKTQNIMKKTAIHLLLFLFIGINLIGQTAINTESLPIPGDTLKVSRLTLLGQTITPAGPNQIWNLSSGIVSNNQQHSIYYAAGDGIFRSKYPLATLVAKNNISDSIETYFRVTSTGIYNLGTAAKDPIGFGAQVFSKYEPAYWTRPANINYLDTFAQNSNFIGAIPASALPDTLLSIFPIAPDSIRLKNVIKRTLKADAWGLMTLPSGQSFDVLRVKQTQINDQRFEAKFSFLGWQDITSLIPGGGFGTGIDTVVSYQFYNNQTKEVLCNMTTDSTFQRVVNITIKTTKPIVNSNQEVTILKTPIKVFPNPAASHINLELPDYQNLKYQKLTVWDALGRMVITRDLDKNVGIPSLNIGALSTGKYILEAHTSDGKVSRGSFQKL
jgi:hypothetical protein